MPYDARDLVFDRVIVDHLVRGGTRVSWGLFYQFLDPEPYSFVLQWAPHGDPNGEDWAAIGLPVINAFYAIDDAKHIYGMNPTTHYRVQLLTSKGLYYSRPVPVFGILDKHSWLTAKEIVREEELRFHKQPTGKSGMLLKRRRQGQTQTLARAQDPRTMVKDPFTGDLIERQSSGAIDTEGTEYVGGYYKPMPIVIGFEPGGQYERIDPAKTRGNVDEDALYRTGRVLVLPPLAHKDIFVADGTDERYEVHKIRYVATIAGVPLIAQVDLRLIPYSDIIYNLDLNTL